MRKFRSLPLLFFLCLFLSLSLYAGPKDPIVGAEFESFKSAQNIELQSALRECLTEEQGYIVVGPLDPRVTESESPSYYHTVRVICPNLESQAGAANLLAARAIFSIKNSFSFVEKPSADALPGYRGILLDLTFEDKPYDVQLQTLQQLRFLLWAKDNLISPPNPDQIEPLKKYAAAVSEYLFLMDKQKFDTPSPKAVEFGLPESADIYAPAPAYVIEGYKNYKDFLFSHAEIVTDFTKGFLGFVPTDSTLARLKSKTAATAYPNKEAPLLQEEFKKFVERGGLMSSMRTLTKALFDSLQPGEYFFAVGINGTVRFGRELTREEVAKIEETGKKPARGNHAFLFPGEPIMTAGAFFIGCDSPGQITAINTQSGHYFYSNITSTIREDISERSDSYFVTVGHMLMALDNLGIDYNGAVISKL
jgi:hypothetical protein